MQEHWRDCLKLKLKEWCPQCVVCHLGKMVALCGPQYGRTLKRRKSGLTMTLSPPLRPVHHTNSDDKIRDNIHFWCDCERGSLSCTLQPGRWMRLPWLLLAALSRQWRRQQRDNKRRRCLVEYGALCGNNGQMIMVVVTIIIMMRGRRRKRSQGDSEWTRQDKKKKK